MFDSLNMVKRQRAYIILAPYLDGLPQVRAQEEGLARTAAGAKHHVDAPLVAAVVGGHELESGRAQAARLTTCPQQQACAPALGAINY